MTVLELKFLLQKVFYYIYWLWEKDCTAVVCKVVWCIEVRPALCVDRDENDQMDVWD